jgi:hypothetical protein
LRDKEVLELTIEEFFVGIDLVAKIAGLLLFIVMVRIVASEGAYIFFPWTRKYKKLLWCNEEHLIKQSGTFWMWFKNRGYFYFILLVIAFIPFTPFMDNFMLTLSNLDTKLAG